MKPLTLHGIAICPKEEKAQLFTSAPGADCAWLRSRLPPALAGLLLTETLSKGFGAGAEDLDRATAALAAQMNECEKHQPVSVFPGSTIGQRRRGTLGCLLRVGCEVHLITAEHVLAPQEEKAVWLKNSAGAFTIARATNLNGGLMASATPLGDFALGKLCTRSGIKLMAMPCGAIRPTGNWVQGGDFEDVCGLAVHACVRMKLRAARALGVSACVGVLYSSLPAANPTFKRFNDHLTLRAEEGSAWEKGDSGAMVFAAEDRGKIKKGDALGIMFAISGDYLCVTPFERIAKLLLAQGKTVEILR